ncbi:BRCA1-associated RING domain protein 1 [Trichoplax sp. H2]|nr:BRCA1-associated RING domain protein 1 [Trichoplax sp. H2]|eukprot:RDD42688.1 BRCA1-associated RING domain protein 1 [Trichoplax sp. H2]
MAVESPWPKTIQALSRLSDALSCCVCKKLMTKPSVAAECGHFFCSRCFTGSRCARCNAFFYSKDIKVDRQLEGAIGTLEKLKSLTTKVIPTSTNDEKKTEKNVSQRKRKVESSHDDQIDLVVKNKKTEKSSKSSKVSAVDKKVKVKRNNKGETQLHLAAIKGDEEKIKSLLIQGVDPNVKDFAGWSPLHEACNYGQLQAVNTLLASGCDVNILGMDNVTPLHDAVYNNHMEIVQSLLRHGADKTIKNSQGLTPADCTSNARLLDVLTCNGEESDDQHSLVNDRSIQLKLNTSAVDVASMPSHRSPQIVLLPSGLKKKDDKDLLDKCIRDLNFKTLMTFSNDITHVIVVADENSCCPRTLKYLNAVLAGKWIVDIGWARQSLKLGYPANEMDYELKGSKDVPDMVTPKRARENRGLKLPGLFHECKFYFMNEFKPPAPSKEELIELVQRGEGTVLSRRPEKESTSNCRLYHSEEIFPSSSFIVYDPKCTKHIVRRHHSFNYVTFQWIMNCISCFKLLKLQDN